MISKKDFRRYRIELSKLEEAQVLKFLAGDIASRELGKNLNLSHQQSINFIGSICRQWFQNGNLHYSKQPSKV